MLDKYIGGNFSSNDMEAYQLTITKTQLTNFFPEKLNALNRSFLETGADAIASILNEISKKMIKIWFPENYCEDTINRIILKTGIKTQKYLAIENISNSLETLDIVVLVHFNGYCKNIVSEIITLKQRTNILIIEDYVHAPLELIKFTGDYAFNSLRKIINAEVAIVYKKEVIVPKATLSTYYLLKKEAEVLKTDFFLNHDLEIEKQFLHKFSEAEKSLMNKTIWGACEKELNKVYEIDLIKIKEKRQKNFKYLKQTIERVKQIEMLYGDYLFLMIKCNGQRNELKKHLHANKILAPIHWADSNSEISKHILSLPIDQRYDFSDMDRISAAIIDFYK